MPAAAIVGAAAVGAVASSRASKKAAKAQKNASKNAIDAETAAQDRALELQRPQREAGWAATAAMMDMTGLPRPKSAIDAAYNPSTGTYEVPGPFGRGIPARAAPQITKESSERPPDLGSYDKYDWKQDPGYQFRMDEGIRAIDRSASSRGVLGSGGTGRALVRYGQDYASNEYQNVYNRIATIAGYGNAAASQGSTTVVNTGTNNANAITNAGEARASGYVAQGNAWSNAFNQVGTAAGYYGWGGPSGGVGGGTMTDNYQGPVYGNYA